ncbi:MAG: hypothetical protein JWR85_3586 [Marmoricola sp.]|nr:hypothetical protein [Marmoricola sp.]
MASFNSLELTPPVYPVSGVGLGGRTTHTAYGRYTTAATLATGDTIAMFDLPPRARIKHGFIKSAQLDTSTGLTLSLGTVATPTLFFNASTVGRTAGGAVDRALSFTGTDFITTGKTRVIMTATAGATTGANGDIVCALEYTVEEPA